MKKLISILILFISINCYSQDCLNIYGQTIDDSSNSIDAIMLVTDDLNTFVKVIQCKNGQFDVNLPLKMDYTITFMQQGYKSKSIDINVTEKGDFKFYVRLDKSELQSDPIPVAKIFYDYYSETYNYSLVKH